MTYHRVGSCTIWHVRWYRNTDFCNSPSFVMIESRLIETILSILWGFSFLTPESLYYHRHFSGGYPTDISLFYLINTILRYAQPNQSLNFIIIILHWIRPPLYQMGCDYIYILLSLLLFTIFKCSCQKTISVLRIVEYSTISTLDYFKDTLSNVELSKFWLEWQSNDMTRIENNCVKREMKRIGEKAWAESCRKLWVE